ncbi:MAG: alpha-amylase family glycosyl hydrolase [Verrucomicrobiota bacterium]|nr:alpha-amylase family glycosyl hydrolase [Verrucomicrobiota bacterium]
MNALHLPKPEAGRVLRQRSQGAAVLGQGGVRYRTWCEHPRVEVVILDARGLERRAFELDADGSGYFSGWNANGKAGELYKYRFGESGTWPDPASRYQPKGVHGPSMVVDPDSYSWGDAQWSRPNFDDLVIYELHIGTFTPEGTFLAAINRLGQLASLGINAIEIMPVADFPGERNWGYDGAMLYAPARVYGTPDDLRALVDAAHQSGIAVILDVVYNHFGPDGNYTGAYHHGYYAEPKEETPWGAALNSRSANARHVREIPAALGGTNHPGPCADPGTLSRMLKIAPHFTPSKGQPRD